MLQQKADIIRQLQRDILPLQGYKPLPGTAKHIGLGLMEKAFPNGIFPIWAIHECITNTPEEGAATAGFMSGLLAGLTKNNSTCIWVSTSRRVFPPALQAFGLLPERMLFVDVQKEKDALWVMEEALKCEGLAAVIGEIRNLDFKTSRRLQLAVEQSRVTGFIIRHNLKQLNTIACVARWKIAPLASDINMPGVGFARWKVELLKVRNGKPGSWEMEWHAGKLRIVQPEKQPIWLTGLSHYGSAI